MVAFDIALHYILLQAAFRGLAMKWHPDRYPDAKGKDEAGVKFRQVMDAYQVLRDPSKRAAYDAGMDV
jgi:DnaJ-class molecular chaperone